MSNFRCISIPEDEYIDWLRALDKLRWALGKREGMGSHANMSAAISYAPRLIEKALEQSPELMRGYGPSVELREKEVTR